MNNKKREKTATKLFMVFLMAVIATTPVATLVMTSQEGTTQLPTATTQEPQVARAPTPQKEWNYTTGDSVWSSPAVADVDADGQLEVIIGSFDKKVYCLNRTGGKEWDYTTGSAIESSPCVADVDDDGQLEILVGSWDGKVYCLNVTGGTPKVQWSYQTGDGIRTSPCVADINVDGKMEVIVGSDDNKVYCLNRTGGSTWNFTATNDIISSPCVADLDGDSYLEVLVADSGGTIWRLSGATGSWEWQCITGYTIACSPTIADIDRDGTLEIIIGTFEGRLLCLNTTGVDPLEWSYLTGNRITSSPCVADVDGDGQMEVLVGSYDWKLYCLNSTGGSKWSASTAGFVYSSPCIADVDGDGGLEVLVGSVDDILWVLNQGGGYEWSYTAGNDVLSSPCAADIDGDGQLEVLFGSEDMNVYCLSVVGAPVNPGAFPWPSICFHGDIRHTGLYTDTDGDNLTNNYEAIIGTNPSQIDTDGDRLTDYREFIFSTNPFIDSVKPGTITNLFAVGQYASSVTLTWTAPGGNGDLDLAAGYIVKYSTTGPITEVNWGSATTYTQSWTPQSPGTIETRSVSGLGSDTRYWFAVKAFDGVPNYGDISNSPTATTLDTTPPATIANLAVIASTATSVTLTWTAPGDNGTLGTATGYIIKYSTLGSITNVNWDSATTYTQSWTPLVAGSNETHTLTGLAAGTSYWFAVKAFDEVPNYGSVSNSPGVTTSSTGGTGDTGAIPVGYILIIGGSVAAVVVVVSIIILMKRK